MIAAPKVAEFDQPRQQLVFYFVAIVFVLGIGQLYINKLMLPERDFAARVINQVLIFSPVLLLISASRQPMRSSYLGLSQAPGGLAIGMIATAVALVGYLIARGQLDSFYPALQQLPSSKNGALAVQILLEDIAIGAGLARLTAATGAGAAIVTIATLFAAAHAPAILAVSVEELSLSSMVLDTLLGVLVGGAIIATRSIWWVFPIHITMDLMQFV